jgi:predicted site-specific integrase-resolvase
MTRVEVVRAEPLCLDIKAAAASVGVSVWVLRRWINEGLLPTVKFPSTSDSRTPSRRVLIAADDLRAFVNQYREVVR